eukprot:8053205-Pyramimonas_sp.AAC.2
MGFKCTVHIDRALTARGSCWDVWRILTPFVWRKQSTQSTVYALRYDSIRCPLYILKSLPPDPLYTPSPRGYILVKP